jgi:hypothetical protein
MNVKKQGSQGSVPREAADCHASTAVHLGNPHVDMVLPCIHIMSG